MKWRMYAALLSLITGLLLGGGLYLLIQITRLAMAGVL